IINSIRQDLTTELSKRSIRELDANSYIRGKDFLSKIWRQVLAVPLGIAIVSKDMKVSTISNIFYEIGVLNALGKETIVIKSKDFSIPSDFIRTEYIEYDEKFSEKINKFLDQVFELADHYEIVGESLEANPILTIDYYKRAYLITGDPKYFRKTEEVIKGRKFDIQSNHFIKNFLTTEKRLEMKKKNI
ncbi:MAG TPA: hypothetical protein VJ954_01055, partial [Ignavibacteriaceae bacterium]|nr:hypothetical protein [Ignavibacteriaceae bacterium]